MKSGKTAIVLASFGTTVPTAVQSIINIQQHIEKAFPKIPVKHTFTSNIIRKIWKKRQTGRDQWLQQGIPAEIIDVKGIIATIGELQEEGFRTIIVQPTHIYAMEQFIDLVSYIEAFNQIKTIKKRWMPFDKIVVGRPALGGWGDHYDYHEDMEKALKTLEDDVALARKEQAALVYMAHGNDHMSTGIYGEAQKMMGRLYPDIQTFFGAVEGYPELEDVLAMLRYHSKNKKVVLKPFMIVAGDHAVNDMAGEKPDSWQNVIAKEGFKVLPVLHGLGENHAFAEIFVDHIRDTARDHEIDLNNEK
ncbi:MAG: sirohydrochlorin cobaltochelatase [Deltaproteobacteria bacterium]|nr:sirohydrochlorin cobaltochelatase [Candidatus Tharpella sp.]